MNEQKDLLIISGFDPSGGAGALRDNLIASSLEMSSDIILSSLTVQNSKNFDSFYRPNLKYFEKSLKYFSKNKYLSLKLGLITDIELAKILYDNLINTNAWNNIEYKILDPILKASAGKSLFWNDTFFDFILKKIIPKFDVITPNKQEAILLGQKLKIVWNTDKDLCQKLSQKLNISVIMTGGDEQEVIDYLYDFNKKELFVRKAEKINLAEEKKYLRHGTGCVFSTALSCFLAKGDSLFVAGQKAGQVVEANLSN